MQDYWQKQQPGSPIYEDILWSRPEHRDRAGKLLIVGGNIHGFFTVGEAYQAADKAGAGISRVLLPDTLRKTVGNMLENTEYAPSSTRSGSFGQSSLAELMLQSEWADMVLIAGDLGKNSETSIMLESYVQKYHGPLTLTSDSIDYFYSQPELVSSRDKTIIVLTMSQLQKFATALRFQTPILLDMGLMLLAQALHEFTLAHNLIIVTKELEYIVVAHGGQVSSTKQTDSHDTWQPHAAARAATYAMQHPQKPFEAITTSFS